MAVQQSISMAEPPEVMDIRAAAAYLRISRESLYKYVSDDKIPAFKLGNRWRFKKTVLDRWMEKQSIRSEQRPGQGIRAKG
jgi:excisionase family DNA binding protein